MSEPTIAILDYGIGNLHSAHKGFAPAGANAVLTRDPAVIAAADGVVLPGVGAFGPCVEAIRSGGLDKGTHERIAAGVPFFGICVGMQVLFSGSDESPGVDGLGVFGERIVALPDTVKRPQMQWNMIDRTVVDHPMFEGLAGDAGVYFVHSYTAEPGPDVVATCAYGDDLVAAVGRDHVWACQFHPEKSGRNGLRILENFVAAAREA